MSRISVTKAKKHQMIDRDKQRKNSKKQLIYAQFMHKKSINYKN